MKNWKFIYWREDEWDARNDHWASVSATAETRQEAARIMSDELGYGPDDQIHPDALEEEVAR